MRPTRRSRPTSWTPRRGSGCSDRMDAMKLVVGITGASGAIYGVRFLEVLHEAYPEVETHLVDSKAGLRVLRSDGRNEARRRDHRSLRGHLRSPLPGGAP